MESPLLPWSSAARQRHGCLAVSHASPTPQGEKTTGALPETDTACIIFMLIAGDAVVCIAQDEGGGRSLYRYCLSSPLPPALPIAGPAFVVGCGLLPVCDKCQRAHVTNSIMWLVVTSAGALLFGTVDEDVYLTDGHGCGGRMVVSLRGRGVCTLPVLLPDGSAFLFSNGAAIWAVSLMLSSTVPPLSSSSAAAAAAAAAAAGDMLHLSPFISVASAHIHRDVVGTEYH